MADKNMIPGGFSEEMDATPEIQKICDGVKSEVERITNQKFEEFKAVKYIYQVVAGTNYCIKVHVGGEKYLHLSVFSALDCYGGGLQLRGLEQNKTKDDHLVFKVTPL